MIDRLALILALAGCALFAAIVGAEVLTAPASESDLAAPAGRAEAVAAPPAVRPQPGLQYDAMVAAILARPLFSPTRRPPAHEDNPTEDTALADTRLTGIVTEPGHRFAIFAPAGAKPVIVGEGGSVSGWRVESITPLSVSLSGPGGTKTMQPKIDPNRVPPPSPVMAPAVPSVVPGVRPMVGRTAVRPGLPPGLLNRAPARPGEVRP